MPADQAASAPAGATSRSPLSGYIRGLDGVRAIAVSFVLLAHAGLGDRIPGGFGVTIFFALSGLLITTLLLDEVEKDGHVHVGLFYLRRALRLLPELLMFLAITELCGQLLGWKTTNMERLASLFYFWDYYYSLGPRFMPDIGYPWAQLWSLAVEEHFYMLFPLLLAWTARKKSTMFGLLWALVLVPPVWRCITYYALGFSWQYNYTATDTRIDSIAWGCLLAAIVHGKRGDDIGKKLGFVNPLGVIAGTAIILFSLLFRSEDFRWTWRFTIQGFGLVLLFGNLLFARYAQWLVDVLEWRPIRYMGRISYSLYLYHMLINRLLEYWLEPGPVFMAVALVSALIVASASYWLVEVPLKPVRRRFGSRVR